MVELAQLAEHQIVVLRVVGSSPTFHPNLRQSFVWLTPFSCKVERLRLIEESKIVRRSRSNAAHEFQRSENEGWTGRQFLKTVVLKDSKNIFIFFVDIIKHLFIINASM